MRISDWSSDVCSSELDKLSVFGLVEGEEARLIKPLVRTLMAREALSTTEHGGLMFGPAGRAVMTGEVPVLMAEPPARRMNRTSRGEGAGANPVGEPLVTARGGAGGDKRDDRVGGESGVR